MAYLFGWLAKKTSPKKPSTTKGFFAGILLIFAGYLLMGLSIDESTGRYKPRTMLSGFPPPVCYSFLGCEESQSVNERLSIVEQKQCSGCRSRAETLGRPVLFDFTGHACVNCRKVEEQIWIINGVHELIEEDLSLLLSMSTSARFFPKKSNVLLRLMAREKTYSHRRRHLGNGTSY